MGDCLAAMETVERRSTDRTRARSVGSARLANQGHDYQPLSRGRMPSRYQTGALLKPLMRWLY